MAASFLHGKFFNALICSSSYLEMYTCVVIAVNSEVNQAWVYFLAKDPL